MPVNSVLLGCFKLFHEGATTAYIFCLYIIHNILNFTKVKIVTSNFRYLSFELKEMMCF